MRTRTLALVLAISVALNLFLLGVLAARVWQRAELREARNAHSPRREHRQPEPLGWLSDAERAELRPRRKALRALREDAEQLLRAESFDSGKFRTTLEALRRQTDGIQASVHELLTKRAESLSAEQRRRLADAWTPQSDAAEGRGRGDGARHGHRREGNQRGHEK
jgi:uncharacterized membrane protein